MSNNTRKSRLLRLFLRRNFATLTVLPLLLVLVVYACIIEPNSLAVNTHTFEHPAISANINGTTVVFVSDLHVRTRDLPKLEKLVDEINKLKPDLILLGGDFVNGSGECASASELVARLQKLSAPLGVYAVPGNHEYRRNIEEIFNAFGNSHIKMLPDHNVLLQTANGGVINLVGLDYQTNPHRRQDSKRLEKLFSKEHFNLVLTHTPEDFEYLSDQAHLVLAGHTHGGQITIPLLGSVINPYFGRKLNYGWKKSGNKTMFVSCGINSAYQTARLGMKPEIVVIKLQSAGKN